MVAAPGSSAAADSKKTRALPSARSPSSSDDAVDQHDGNHDSVVDLWDVKLAAGLWVHNILSSHALPVDPKMEPHKTFLDFLNLLERRFPEEDNKVVALAKKKESTDGLARRLMPRDSSTRGSEEHESDNGICRGSFARLTHSIKENWTKLA